MGILQKPTTMKENLDMDGQEPDPPMRATEMTYEELAEEMEKVLQENPELAAERDRLIREDPMVRERY